MYLGRLNNLIVDTTKKSLECSDGIFLGFDREILRKLDENPIYHMETSFGMLYSKLVENPPFIYTEQSIKVPVYEYIFSEKEKVKDLLQYLDKGFWFVKDCSVFLFPGFFSIHVGADGGEVSMDTHTSVTTAQGVESAVAFTIDEIEMGFKYAEIFYQLLGSVGQRRKRAIEKALDEDESKNYLKKINCHLRKILPDHLNFLDENIYKKLSKNDHKEIATLIPTLMATNAECIKLADELSDIVNESNAIHAHQQRTEFGVFGKDSGKLERCFYFIDASRRTSDLPVKIANYVIILEILFGAGSKSELSEKVTTRAALFMGQDKAERQEIKTRLKAAYNMRSKCLHGASLSRKDMAILTDTSVFLDGIIRMLLAKVINEINTNEIMILLQGDHKELGDFFMDLQMG